MTNFVEKLSKKIVDWCAKDGMSEEEEEVLVYGYSLILENLYKMIILLIIAAFTGTLWQSFVIIGSLAFLRGFAGGIHCSSSLGCTVCMVGVWGLGLIISWIEIPMIVLAVMAVIVIWTILRYAPQSTQNNPIVDETIIKRKQIGSRIAMCVLLSCGIASYICLNRTDILNMVLTSMLIEAFSILLLIEKEEKNNEGNEA